MSRPLDLAGKFVLLSFAAFLYVPAGEAAVAGEPSWFAGERVEEGPIVAVLRGGTYRARADGGL